MITVEQPDAAKLEEVKQWEIWEKEPCTFEHDQQKTESFYILEGNAVLTTDANGKTEEAKQRYKELIEVESAWIPDEVPYKQRILSQTF